MSKKPTMRLRILDNRPTLVGIVDPRFASAAGPYHPVAHKVVLRATREWQLAWNGVRAKYKRIRLRQLQRKARRVRRQHNG